MATIEFLEGDLDRARELLEQAMQITDECLGYSRCVLAMVSNAEHDHAEAMSLLLDELDMASIEGELETVGHAIGGFGQIAASLGEYQRAAEFTGLADRHYGEANVAYPGQPFWTIRERTLEAVSAALSVEKLERSYRRGHDISAGTTIDFARRLINGLTLALRDGPSKG